MTTKSAPTRRWLQSSIAASAEPMPNMPWSRQARAERTKAAAVTPLLAAARSNRATFQKSAIAAR